MLISIRHFGVFATIALLSTAPSAHAGVWSYGGQGGVGIITGEQGASNNGRYTADIVNDQTGEVKISVADGYGPFYQGQSSWINRRIECTLQYDYDDSGDLIDQIPSILNLTIAGSFSSTASTGTAGGSYNSAGSSANVAVDFPVTGYHVIVGGSASAGYYISSDTTSNTASTVFNAPPIPAGFGYTGSSGRGLTFTIATYAGAQGNRMIAGSFAYGGTATASYSVISK